MKTDTLWFRLALSVAVLWLAFWGYRSITAYGAAKASDAAYESSPDRYADCYDEKLIIGSGTNAYSYRAPTSQEIGECHRITEEVRVKIEAGRPLWNKLINERNALSSFFYRGLLPAGIVLLILAGWEWIAAAFLYYTNWLKTGKTKVD